MARTSTPPCATRVAASDLAKVVERCHPREREWARRGTTHALRRMLKHGIRSGQIREALEKGERVEDYPDDTPLPSYLMLGTGAGRVLRKRH